MHFCVNCSNMYYIRLSEEDPNSIVYYCRNCGHENKNISLDSVTVSKTNFKNAKQKYNSIINKYTKMDPTLPRINTIKCPNQSCISNGGEEGSHVESHGEDVLEVDVAMEREGTAVAVDATKLSVPKIKSKHKEPEREIIYLRYDDVNMNFVYLCATCDTVWNTEQSAQ
jgi:DNA-directed RNA polymerase subunit M/transcription elongation factor TFIIS